MRPPVRTRAGFTLVEMLAVLMILLILSFFLVPQLTGASKSVQIGAAQTRIDLLDARITDFENEKGDFPRSTFPRDLDPKPSKANMGAEMLVISLWGAKDAWQAPEVDVEWLGNSDRDNTGTSLTSFTKADAFEIVDPWDNPIAYIHNRDYDEVFHYVTIDEDGNQVDDDQVAAAVSATTGDPLNRRGFQLISAGPDGRFGTPDDLANFDVGDRAP
jgi:prepilin-type N-terminal cleavage/methylation domain-containing protein